MKHLKVHKERYSYYWGWPHAQCGLELRGVLESHKTWRGVTCKRCLQVKGKR